MQGPKIEGDVEANYSDIRKLQIRTDKLHRLHQILSVNIRLGQKLEDTLQRIERGPSMVLLGASDGTHTALERFLYDQKTSLDRIETLISRSTGIGQLVSHKTAKDFTFSKCVTWSGAKYPRN
jgi:hypothetical protein